MYKHPKALVVLFFTEMWERFSFYGMRALLTLYLTLQLFNHLQDPDRKSIAIGIYAAYGALVYATPFFGGLLADKFLGHKRAVIWGAILMAIGHFIMAIETEFFLYVALSFLIIGNGFFKPNISSIVGSLYSPNDPRRDGAFTIFYMGVNLGAFFSPLVCGYIGETRGWHWGFGIAGVGMIAGLVMFLLWGHLITDAQKKIGTEHYPPQRTFIGIQSKFWVYIGSIVSVVLFALLVKHYEYMTAVLTPFTLLVLGIILVIAIRSPKIERERLFVIIILLLFSTLFWSFFEQAGSSLTLFANENIYRTIGGLKEIPASALQSINPLFIITFAPIFTIMWTWFSKKGIIISTPTKFALGILLLSIGFFILAYSPYFVSEQYVSIDKSTIIKAATVPIIILIVSYFFQTIGELCLSPIGLSMVTKLSSPRMVGMIMGAWFLSSAMAHHVAGFIAKATTSESHPTELMYEHFLHNSSESMFLFSKDDFIKTHKEELLVFFNTTYNSLLYECDDALQDTKHIDAACKAVIQAQAYTILTEKNITNNIANIRIFENSLLAAILYGMESAIHKGEEAIKTATQQAYITTDEIPTFSLSSKVSLAHLLHYASTFKTVGIIAFAASALLFLLSPLIRKMMHGID